jgi:hypothetical protein
MRGRFARCVGGALASGLFLVGCDRPDDVIATLGAIDVPASPCALPAGQQRALRFSAAAGALAWTIER